MKVYIYGRGIGLAYVKRCLKGDVQILAYIDNYEKNCVDSDGVIIAKESDIGNDFDFIIISIIQFCEIKEGLLKKGIAEERIVSFFDMNDAENIQFHRIIDPFKWKTELLWRYTREYVEPLNNNIFYEMNAEDLLEDKSIPNIMTVEETIELVINGEKSLVRFGDGEFDMMRRQHRMRFQDVDDNLSKRLIEVLSTDDKNIVVCIADNYGKLNEYTDRAAFAIRYYLTPSVRKDHMALLNMKKTYGNAYLSRPYFMYRNKDKDVMNYKFNMLKKIWADANVLVIEGEHTRFGVGNDLLEGACCVERILVPDKNAFDYYDEIIEKAKRYAKNRLVLCIIGPTATVLSYDLASSGFRAIDIGQVDSEYEWFLRDAPERCDVPYKTVSEYVDKKIFSEMECEMMKKYQKEVIDTVGVGCE